MPKPNRGRLLTIYLIIMIAVSGVNLIFDITGKTQELPFYENYPGWMFYWFTAANLFSLVCFFAMWKMKKWGVFGSIALMAIGNTLFVYFSDNSKGIWISAIGIIIFALVVWKPYKRMA